MEQEAAESEQTAWRAEVIEIDMSRSHALVSTFIPPVKSVDDGRIPLSGKSR